MAIFAPRALLLLLLLCAASQALPPILWVVGDVVTDPTFSADGGRFIYVFTQPNYPNGNISQLVKVSAASGVVQWKMDFPNTCVDTPRTSSARHDGSDEVVIFTTCSGSIELVAVNGSTGTQMWSKWYPQRYINPSFTVFNDGGYVVLANVPLIYVYELATGNEIGWHANGCNMVKLAYSAITRNLFIITLDPQNNNKINVVKFDPKSNSTKPAKVVWSFDSGFMPSVSVGPSYVVLTTVPELPPVEQVFVLALDTGVLLWEKTFFGINGPLETLACQQDGVVLLLGQRNVTKFGMNGGRLRWTTYPYNQDVIEFGQAVVDDRLYLPAFAPNYPMMYVIDLTNGNVTSVFPVQPQGFSGSPSGSWCNRNTSSSSIYNSTVIVLTEIEQYSEMTSLVAVAQLYLSASAKTHNSAAFLFSSQTRQ